MCSEWGDRAPRFRFWHKAERLLLAAMLALLAPAGAVKRGNVTINGDLRVVGGLSVNHIVSTALQVNGSITVSGSLNTGYVKAQAAKFAVLETTSLASPSGSLHVTGDLNMRGASGAVSFLEVGQLQAEHLVQHRQRQVGYAPARILSSLSTTSALLVAHPPPAPSTPLRSQHATTARMRDARRPPLPAAHGPSPPLRPGYPPRPRAATSVRAVGARACRRLRVGRAAGLAACGRGGAAR